MTGPTAVTYDGLPIASGGAHSLGRMSRRDAYQRTMTFLETCTELDGPIDHHFALPPVSGLPRASELEAQVKRRFGKDRRIEVSKVPEALAFLDEIDPQPVNPWGMAPVWLWTIARFRILDPATGQPIPGQDPRRFNATTASSGVALGANDLRLILSDKAALGINLCLPDADEDLLGRVVPWLQAYLPFRFSPKQWRAWTPTKTGGWKARKLPSTPAGVSPTVRSSGSW